MKNALKQPDLAAEAKRLMEKSGHLHAAFHLWLYSMPPAVRPAMGAELQIAWNAFIAGAKHGSTER